MAKVTEHLKSNNGKPIFSIEIIPPTKGSNLNDLLNAIEPMMELKPPFIDVTFHREEYFTKQLPDGTTKEVRTRKRPGTVGICSSIMHRFKIDPVPHVLCGGFTKDDTEDLLIDLNYLGIDNVLALRGDFAKPYDTFKAKKDGHLYANELVSQIKEMNQGKYLHEDAEYLNASNFCIGVAAYPEKHFEAQDLDQDMENLKRKIAAGADYIVTQMFFDNQKYFDFVNKCRAEGINVPIIPGLKVLATKKQLDILPRLFYLDMPEAFRKEVLACENDKQAKQIGIEWSIQQCKELIDFGVPALHFYTMSKSDTTMAVAREVF
ncbi:5,10-methylenetetrahydrofolate reductase [Emticicia aquatica]|jgi:methylenetetrahydrofolate reductase (NADPH)|uniref:Methylenetetrahydrofolate reductase n=1 Tax=Emticicia aquatica TaxID=1681835 RepID=A0ABM9AK66_9BACT|nr:methylenetetrahydrofolate reductase [NAD(P)H] [Emticicia aquatica]CAH0994123.1 5,10-methylenetetrahydrofolate reductase [Emticicia aquatica]